MVINMSIPAAATARPRVLSTPWSDVFVASPATHNSIALTGVAPVNAVRGVYGAAKQAAPPRGVPR
jgi:hypothetical protein